MRLAEGFLLRGWKAGRALDYHLEILVYERGGVQLGGFDAVGCCQVGSHGSPGRGKQST